MEIKINIPEKGKGKIMLSEGSETMGEMEVEVRGNKLLAFHTEVFAKEGKGLGTKLFQGLIDYARLHKLKVLPYCPFVMAQFKKDPQQYADLWKKEDVLEDEQTSFSG